MHYEKWEQQGLAAELLQTTPAALRSRGQRNRWPRKKDRGTGGWLYLVPQSREEAEKHGVDFWEGHVEQAIDAGIRREPTSYDDDEPAPAKSRRSEPRIPPYITVGDSVVFSLPSRGYVPLAWSREEVERFCNCYSSDGEGLTINQMCLAFETDRVAIIEIKTALGITKDSLPFSWDRVENEDEDELAAELKFKKAGRIRVKAQRAHWNETVKLADKARDMERFAKEVLERMVVPVPLPMPKWKRGSSVRNAEHSVFSHATDLHYGQGGWLMYLGHESSRVATAQRLYTSTNKLIDRLEMVGPIDTAWIGIGGDWTHVDTPAGTTTKGTPQDTDGRFLQAHIEASELARDQIEIWRDRVARVNVVPVRGNHDYYSSAMILHYLSGVYRESEDVSIGNFVLDRQFLQIGKSLVGVTHGDRMKPTKLRLLMNDEAPRQMLAETEYRIWFTGHHHGMASDEDHGIICVTYPSLSANNGWDKKHGYTGNRMRLQAHVFNHDEGPVASMWAEPDPVTEDFQRRKKR